MRGNTAAWLLALLAAIPASGASIGDDSPGRFDHLVQNRPGGVIRIEGSPVSALPAEDPLRQSWDRVSADQGGEWRVWLDERSGLPTLALVRGQRWLAAGSEASPAAAARDLVRLAARAAGFLEANHTALGNNDGLFVLDREASGRRGSQVWHLRFAQIVDGVPVDGAYFDFHVSHGNLVALGAHRWAPVKISSVPNLDAREARGKLDAYVRPTDDDGISDLGEAELVLVPVDADPSSRAAWRGARGEGIAHRLIWRFRFTDFRQVATWTGEVDAHSGEIVAFYDDTRYDQVKGHVNPISDDGQCSIGGCAEPDYPMPFVGFTEDGGAVSYTNQFGLYECTPGSTIETTLSGQYFWIDDQCGAFTETTTCGTDLDLGVADDVNCGVAAGASEGNTDAARSAYYTLNSINRKARFWLPGVAWLDSQVQCRTNTGGTCNASWGGGVINMNTGGGGCGNTGQLQGLVTHEWGHGIDENDGGGSDNPGEAYADIVAILEARESCIARGFQTSQTCSGYGDTCLTCMGLREMDWDARLTHTPATPGGYLATYCGGGGGPCGKEVHCESHVASETIYDLATRDLPALGIDADTAWQLTERLWYQSRAGSGGEAYNCTIPNSDSCSVGSWFHDLRVQDDDDGDLTNGTPHAAAIFAAFDRHDIACGSSGDAENQNTSSCPAIDAPTLGFTAQTDTVLLDWNSVVGSNGYRVYRNDIGCDRAQFPLAEVDSATLGYLDEGLANGFSVFYRVQAVGTNPTCESPVSNCIEAAAQQLAGDVRFGQPAYGCSDEIEVEVTDLNHPTSSITVTIWSDTEPTPESVVLSETTPGSARYTGTIFSTGSAPAADGLLSVGDGDTITTEYIDLDDGEGGANVPRQSFAAADCVAPVHTSIAVTNITDSGATIDWTTSKTTSSTLEWGTTPALGSVITRSVPAVDHTADIGPFSACSRVYFRIVSTDEIGHTTVADVQGAPFEFNAYMVQGILYEDGFETDSGWTLESDWEIGVPQGLGTSPGDPLTAVEGSQVLGQDLSGQGANPGDYEIATTFSATSPVIDGSSMANVELQFDRWLNSHSSSNAFVEIKDSGGVWQNVWSGTGGLTATAWSRVAYDVSTFADGNPALQIRFIQDARFGIDAGWNIDRLTLRDGNAPLHGACGGCVGPPTFAGAVAATDDDPCSDSSVTVAWAAAPAWGSGGPGTYAVHRDTTPGFTPSGGNLVASGVSGPSWVDTAPPADVDLYYVVRAENDETCGAGPNNGGLVDANLSYVTTVNSSSAQPPPGNVGDTLLAAGATSDVRLDWLAAADATGYNVYRSVSPDSGFVIVGQPGGTSFDDPGALIDGQTWYYRITATNSCGQESPE